MMPIREEIQRMETRLRDNPDSLFFARLADYYLKEERIDDALRVCEEGIKRHPSYVTGHLILGKCYLEKGEYDKAEKEFKRVLLFDPKHLAAHKYHGDLMQKIGWENTAEMSYRKIVQIDPLDEKAKEVLNELRRKREREGLEEALEEVEKPPELSVSPEAPTFAPAPVEEEEEAPPPEVAPPPGAPKVQKPLEPEEEKFSYILDDIFKEEVLDKTEVAVAPSPAAETAAIEPEETLAELLKTETNEVKPRERTPATPREAPPSITPTQPEQLFPREPEDRRERIVTPTLGEIYAAQGQYAKALGVFEILRKKDPTNPRYQEKIEFLKKKLEESRHESQN